MEKTISIGFLFHLLFVCVYFSPTFAAASSSASSSFYNIFKLIDTNQNKNIEWEEFVTNPILRYTQDDASELKLSTEAKNQLWYAFGRLDADGDNAISLSEFSLSLAIDGHVEQVHLALTASNTEMIVMWVTADKTDTSEVRIGTKSGIYSSSFFGNITTYDVGILGGWHKFIHTVRVTGLNPSTKYYYICGDKTTEYSQEYSFSTPPAQAPVIYGLVADMGTYAPMGWAVCQQVTEDNSKLNFAFVAHAGDICYAGTGANDELEEIWDIWGGLVEPFAARVPYMVAIGNHEEYYNATSFQHRFVMPGFENGGNGNLWYSIDHGNVHWIFFSTQDNFAPGSPQYMWLEKDLIKAQSNRNNVAWIVFVTHRPMYCSDSDELDQHRVGAQIQVQLEPILLKYQVDIYFCGHMHMYERIHPLVNGTVVQTGNTYKAPPAMMHIVQGTSGVFTDKTFIQPQPAWSAAREGLWGYGRLTVYNNSALHYEFMSEEQRNVFDEFWILK